RRRTGPSWPPATPWRRRGVGSRSIERIACARKPVTKAGQRITVGVRLFREGPRFLVSPLLQQQDRKEMADLGRLALGRLVALAQHRDGFIELPSVAPQHRLSDEGTPVGAIDLQCLVE